MYQTRTATTIHPNSKHVRLNRWRLKQEHLTNIFNSIKIYFPRMINYLKSIIFIRIYQFTSDVYVEYEDMTTDLTID